MLQSAPLPVSTVTNGNLEALFSRGHIPATRWISLFPLPLSICLFHPLHPQYSQSISISSPIPFILSFPQSISFCLLTSFISFSRSDFFFLSSYFATPFLPVCIKMPHLDPFSVHAWQLFAAKTGEILISFVKINLSVLPLRNSGNINRLSSMPTRECIFNMLKT